MIKSYLEKNRQELLKHQIDLSNQIQRIDMNLNEKKKMIQYIEKSGDKSYDSFIPQNFTMEMDQEKIHDIEKEIEQDQRKMEQLIQSRINIDSKIDEIEIVISNYCENSKQDNQWNCKQELYCLKNRVELCSKLMVIDIPRCRIELRNVLDRLQNIITYVDSLN